MRKLNVGMLAQWYTAARKDVSFQYGMVEHDKRGGQRPLGLEKQAGISRFRTSQGLTMMRSS